jgi:acyl-CoA thioester hydrolase
LSAVRRPGGRRFPTPDQVRELPLQLRTEVPAEWQDRNGHVGVKHVQSLFAAGAWRVLEEVGIDAAWFRGHDRSQFDLEHHVFYRAEMHAGETVSTYNRVLGRSTRTFHGMFFVVNDSTGALAATLEYVTAGIDLEKRRMAAFPEPLRRGLDALIEKHRKLEWSAPVCGTMGA